LGFDPETVLLAGDVLVLRGEGEAVSHAEGRLL
jgi:CPA2 family monovalent cation:H+ antiporter-2